MATVEMLRVPDQVSSGYTSEEEMTLPLVVVFGKKQSASPTAPSNKRKHESQPQVVVAAPSSASALKKHKSGAPATPSDLDAQVAIILKTADLNKLTPRLLRQQICQHYGNDAPLESLC
jgi:hypothetical protein